jgi:hypothetical protein
MLSPIVRPSLRELHGKPPQAPKANQTDAYSVKQFGLAPVRHDPPKNHS